jgi:transcriptional regulator with XRE-family HTH domain
MPRPLRPGQATAAIVGRVLKRLRARRGWSQRALADRARVSLTVIGALEQQRARNVRADTLEQLAAAFGVTVRDLLREPPRLRRRGP